MRDKTKKIVSGSVIPAFTVGIVGPVVTHGEERQEATPPHHEHSHRDEAPDTNPVGQESIEDVTSGVPMDFDRAKRVYYYIVPNEDDEDKATQVVWVAEGFEFPNARWATFSFDEGED
jgi:hypothetical protein